MSTDEFQKVSDPNLQPPLPPYNPQSENKQQGYGGGNYPPPYVQPNDEVSRFDTLVKQKELAPVTASNLFSVLSTTDVVMLCDDSSSMSQAIAEEGTDPFAPKRSSRWLELKKLAASLIEIVTSVNQNGLNIHFLNRPSLLGVTNMNDLGAAFAQPPNGATPLVGALSRLFAEVRQVPRTVLIIVIGDGEASDGSRDDLYRTLCNKGKHVHVSFAECTDQAEDMEYLDAWDGKIPNFDNTDDYREELARVKLAQGLQFKFDYTDYVIKILLATFIRWYFNLDQVRVGNVATTQQTRSNMPSFSPQYIARSAPAYQQPLVSSAPAYVPQPSYFQNSPATTPLLQQVQQPEIKSESKWEALVRMKELNVNVANRLFKVLSETTVVLICDDSGSMNSVITEPATGKKTTRWMELKRLAVEIIGIVTAVECNPLHIWFFNRPRLDNCSDPQALAASFASPPSGGTPLSRTISDVCREYGNVRQLLIVAITDGEPSGPGESRGALKNVITQATAYGNIHVSMADCTDNAADMEYLDEWDGQIKNFDNTDDYREELLKVKRNMGQNFKFDYSDYVAKILLATFDRWFFQLDRPNQDVCQCRLL